MKNKKKKKNQGTRKKGRFQMLYIISFGFGLKCLLVEYLKKKKGSSLTGILYKICRKIQQQQKKKTKITNKKKKKN